MEKEAIALSGTHKEIGAQLGKLYKSWGKREVWIPPFSSDCFTQQLGTYQKYYPEYLEYIEGVALGLNLPKEKVLSSYLTGFINKSAVTPSKCSVFMTKNSNGVLIGRNYDWRQASEAASRLIKYTFTDSSSYNFSGLTDMATWEFNKPVDASKYIIMVDDAWNQAGLYVCINGTPDYKTGLGLAIPHAVQLIVEKCKTTEEAIALLTALPIVHSKIFALADKGGNLAVVEKPFGKEIKVIKSKKRVIATNHYNHPSLLPKNIAIFEDVPFHSTFARYAYIEAKLLNNPKVNIDTVVAIMSKPPVVQNWRNEDVVTCWISAINLTSGKYMVSIGPLTEKPAKYLN